MAENGELMEVNQQQISRKTVIWATIAGIAIEGPILGMMSFSLLSSLILFVVTSPLLVIFSPLLIGVVSVFGLAMAGFGVAAMSAVFGLSSFVVVYRSLIKGIKMGGDCSNSTDVPVTVDKMIQPAETVEVEVEEHQHDTGVPGTVEGTTVPVEGMKEQQEGTTSEPVTVDRMVELFESLKDETSAVPVITVVEESGYLQQNVQRQIPQEI